MLALDAWPQHDGLDDADAEGEIGWVVDLITAIRFVRAEMNIPAATMLPVVMVERFIGEPPRGPRHWTGFVQRLARVRPTFRLPTQRRKARCSLWCAARSRHCRSKASSISPPSARGWPRGIAKADADIARVDAKLGNANFVARAPEEVVEEEKEKREEAQARKAKIAEALERLKGAA